jgi:8-oxo-dGTP pyrophosphatase MutT (NUDIX family)
MRAVRYTAAGGIIVDGDEVLVLRRPSRDEVRLPKGHVKKGETLRETALREVAEESGYVGLEIAADLGQQVVEFNYQDAHVVRDEHYFLMYLGPGRHGERHQEQASEQQFVPEWMAWDAALSALTFEVEREWVRRARQANAQR